MSRWYSYFEVQIEQARFAPGYGWLRGVARFRRHRLFGFLQVFQSCCAPDGTNVWNEPGYGYGRWVRVR